MKKMITTILCLMLTLLFVGCGKADTSEVEIDYGTSSLYPKKTWTPPLRLYENSSVPLRAANYIASPIYPMKPAVIPIPLHGWTTCERKKTRKSLLPNASHLTAASAHRKMAAAHGKRTKNTPGPGGWPGAKAENGSSWPGDIKGIPRGINGKWNILLDRNNSDGI